MLLSSGNGALEDGPAMSTQTGDLPLALTGHQKPVISVDFHQNKDMICSSDCDCEVRCWSINKDSCLKC